MSTANTVHVSNISAQTQEKELHDFLSFCGKINKLELEPASEGTKRATVTFEKETAAKTALLLDNTQLGSTQVQVTSASGSSDDDGSHYDKQGPEHDEMSQEIKPRSRIFAEYLAHGYVVSDAAIQKAIDLDQKHGVSNKFLTTLSNLDKKFAATEKAKSVDQSYAITPKANSLLTGLNSYYEKGASTAVGKKLVEFYTQTSRQVADIHNEARRLADIKKQESSGGVSPVAGTDKTTCECGSDLKSCPCEPGRCACAACPKAATRKVAGTDKTTCDCGGNLDKCPCAPGHCACSSCPKSATEPVPGTNKTKCGCAGEEADCPCEAGKCACAGCEK